MTKSNGVSESPILVKESAGGDKSKVQEDNKNLKEEDHLDVRESGLPKSSETDEK